MNGMIKKAGLGVALAATALTAAAPADAQRYRRYHRGNDAATGALIGGVIGLGLGAAIASSNRDRYYDRGYYNRGYPTRGYYNRGYYDQPRVVYRERYYAPPRAYRRGYAYPRGYYQQPYGYGGYDGYYGY